MYFSPVEKDNIVYSVDMIRLKTYISYSAFTELEFRFNTCWADYVEKKWTSSRAFNFFYNYDIKVEDGKSFYFGFLHNSERRGENDNTKYNFTIEFNPNKIEQHKVLMYLLDLSGDWYIKSLDLACDLRINILDVIFDKKMKRSVKATYNGFDDRTYYIGKGNGRIKIYNKKKESKLECENLTRVEISVEYDDYDIRNIITYKFDKKFFPELYLQKYCYSFSDYKDKTMLAILFAVQNGFPINDLSRVYKKKLKDMLEMGNKIKFDYQSATQAVYKIMWGYFLKLNRKNPVHFR